MSDTQQRDQVSRLAKTNPKKALDKARKISDPWYKAQALSSVVRYTDGDVLAIAAEAAKAAGSCDNEYKRTAARAWEIAALAERSYLSDARKALKGALKSSQSIEPLSSRSEALTLLLHASFRIDESGANLVATELHAACSQDSHWRCKRALRDADEMKSGKLKPREFFW